MARCGSDDPSVGSWDLDKSGETRGGRHPHGIPHGALESHRVTASLLVTSTISKRNGSSRCRPSQFLSQAETQLGQHHQTRVSTRSSQVSRSCLVCRSNFHGRRCTAITLSRSFFIGRKEQSEFPVLFVVGARGRSSTIPPSGYGTQKAGNTSTCSRRIREYILSRVPHPSQLDSPPSTAP